MKTCFDLCHCTDLISSMIVLFSEEQKEEVFETKREPEYVAEDSVNNESMDDEDDYKLSIKEDVDVKDEPDSQDDIGNQNLSQASSCDYSMSQFSKSEPAFEDYEAEKSVKEEPEEPEDSEEDIPLVS